MRPPLPATVASVDELPEKAWERLPGETTAAYRWFILYREMDATVRSLRRLGEEHNRSGQGQLRTWATRFFWTARVARWDDYLEQQARDAQIEAVRAAAGTRAQVVLKGLELVYARLVGRDPVVDTETGDVLVEGVKAITPELDAKDLAALGGLLHKMQVSAEEAAGLKPLDEQVIRIEGLDWMRGPGQPVIEGHASPVPSLELPPGQPDET